MAKALVNGVNLYYEVTGKGFPLVWCHEYAGTCRSWDAQVRFFSRRYKVITYNQRGYLPSDVPTDPQAYSQQHSVEDLHQLLMHLKIRQAYVAGFSMGGAVALNFAVQHPEMVKALVAVGTGTGSTNPARLAKDAVEFATSIESIGMKEWAKGYAEGPTRVQLRRKDPRGWKEFARALAAHSGVGAALTMRGVQGKRPPVFALEPDLRKLKVPTLIVVGDEDEPCLEPSLFLKRCITRSGLVVVPQSGHAVNLEEPDLFNRVVLDFLTAVEADRWPERDWGSGVGFLAGGSATAR